MRRLEGRNHSKIKSPNCWVDDSQTGEHLYHRSPPTGVKVLSPTSGFPTWGVRQRKEEFLENQTLKPSGIWFQEFNRTGGNRDSTLRGHTQSSVCIGTQGKEQWPQGRLNQTYLLVLQGLLQRRWGGGSGSPWGQGQWQQKLWEVLLSMSPPRVCH